MVANPDQVTKISDLKSVDSKTAVDNVDKKLLDERLSNLQKQMQTEMGAMLSTKISEAADKMKQRDDEFKQVYGTDKPTLQVAHVMPTAKHAEAMIMSSAEWPSANGNTAESVNGK